MFSFYNCFHPACAFQTGVLQSTREGHTHWVTSFTFSTDGKHIISGCEDGTVRLSDRQTGVLQSIHKGHTRPSQLIPILARRSVRTSFACLQRLASQKFNKHSMATVPEVAVCWLLLDLVGAEDHLILLYTFGDKFPTPI